MNKKKLFLVLGLTALFIFGAVYIKIKYYDKQVALYRATQDVRELADSGRLKNGDIIFQTSLSPQSRAIQLATHSKYSHCGLIFNLDTAEVWYVLEAENTVSWTPLTKWISRGYKGHYVIKRVKGDTSITNKIYKHLKTTGEQFLGKFYDCYFDWSDDEIYCSELVWKAYNQTTGLEIGKLQPMRELDLTNSLVKAKMKQRYADSIPLDQKVITPASIFNSDLLITVDEK